MVEAPAGTNDYVTNGSIRVFQEAAENKAEQLAQQGNVPNPIVRDTLPSADFDPGADITGGLDASFEVDPASSTTIKGGEEVEVYDLDSDRGNADDRAFTLYGGQLLGNTATGDLVEVRIRDSSGRLLERAQIEGIEPVNGATVSGGETFAESHFTFRSPFAFGVSDNRTIHFVFDDTATDGLVNLKLLMVTAEKEGREIGNV